MAGVLDADAWRLDLDIDMLREGRGDAGETEKRRCRDEKQFFLHTSGFSFHERVCIDGGGNRGAAAQPMEPGRDRRVAQKIFSQMAVVMVCGESKAARAERCGTSRQSCPG